MQIFFSWVDINMLPHGQFFTFTFYHMTSHEIVNQNQVYVLSSRLFFHGSDWWFNMKLKVTEFNLKVSIRHLNRPKIQPSASSKPLHNLYCARVLPNEDDIAYFAFIKVLKIDNKRLEMRSPDQTAIYCISFSLLFAHKLSKINSIFIKLKKLDSLKTIKELTGFCMSDSDELLGIPFKTRRYLYKWQYLSGLRHLVTIQMIIVSWRVPLSIQRF